MTLAGPLGTKPRAAGGLAGVWRATIERVDPDLTISVPNLTGQGQLQGRVEAARGLTDLAVGDKVWVACIQGVRTDFVVLCRREEFPLPVPPPPMNYGLAAGTFRYVAAASPGTSTRAGQANSGAFLFGAGSLAIGTENANTARSYTPTWSGGTVNPSGATINASYQIFGQFCFVHIHLDFTAGTSGGTGPLALTLPVPALAGVEEGIPCKTWVPGLGLFCGICYVQAAALSVLTPNFPINDAHTALGVWQGAAPGAAVGTGVPQYPGNYTVLNGGNFTAQGVYRIA